MTHIGGYPRRYDPRALERIRAVQPRLFIAGHSHILKVMFDPAHNLLAVNPGGEFKRFLGMELMNPRPCL